MKATFKANLRSELDYAGLTVKELSAKTGISKRTLDCYLGARASMPPADIAAKIANALCVTVEYLVNSQETKNITNYWIIIFVQ
jgi:transcriptional regulator with XRE-family HTH domain